MRRIRLGNKQHIAKEFYRPLKRNQLARWSCFQAESRLQATRTCAASAFLTPAVFRHPFFSSSLPTFPESFFFRLPAIRGVKSRNASAASQGSLMGRATGGPRHLPGIDTQHGDVQESRRSAPKSQVSSRHEENDTAPAINTRLALLHRFVYVPDQPFRRR
jgi:hypothetical protein